MPKNPLHVIKIPGNAHGNDFISTDPHGSLEALTMIVEMLKPNDRLFLCGDLVDRGTNSLGVLEYIFRMRAHKTIYIIRGNHEDMLLSSLDFLDMLDEIKTRLSAIDDGGAFITFNLRFSWLSELSPEQMRLTLKSYLNYWQDGKSSNKWIFNTMEDCQEYMNYMNFIKQKVPVLIKLIDNFYNHMKNYGSWIKNLNAEKRAWIRSMIEPLPYIIHVDEVQIEDTMIQAFDIVHAAPLSEARIQQVLDNQEKLTEDEIYYITWSRPEIKHAQDPRITKERSGRTIRSTRTYAGHEIHGVKHAIYENINTLVLDVSTAATGCMLAANHTQNRIDIVSSATLENISTDVISSWKLLNAQAKKYPSFTNIDYVHLKVKAICGGIYNNAKLFSEIDRYHTPNALKKFKENFISEVCTIAKELTFDEKNYLLDCILEDDDHYLLYKEFYKQGVFYFTHYERYSNTTEAINIIKQILTTNSQVTNNAEKINWMNLAVNYLMLKNDAKIAPEPTTDDRFEL